MADIPTLKQQYRQLDLSVLVLIILPLSVFGLVYLYSTNPVRTIQSPQLPAYLDFLLLSVVLALLMFQQIDFHRKMKDVNERGLELERKFETYARATVFRYWLLLVIGFLCAAGLFFYQNIGFTIVYAFTLIVVSIAKPSPSRITRIFRLSGKEKEIIYDITRPS